MVPLPRTVAGACGNSLPPLLRCIALHAHLDAMYASRGRNVPSDTAAAAPLTGPPVFRWAPLRVPAFWTLTWHSSLPAAVSRFAVPRST